MMPNNLCSSSIPSSSDNNIPCTDLQSALLNMLDDIQGDNELLEKQRLATVKLMNDLVAKQKELRESRKKFKDLNNLLLTLSKKTSIREALEFLGWSLIRTNKFKKIIILSSSGQNSLKVFTSLGEVNKKALSQVAISLRQKSKILNQAYHQGKYFSIANIEEVKSFLENEVQQVLGLTSFLVMPLATGLGSRMLIIADRGALQPYLPKEEVIFKTITSQAEAVLIKLILVSHLHNQKLRLQELDKMKNEFLSVASHQLRTPLGSMRWNIEMLLAGDYGQLSQNIAETVSQVYESNQRMIGLVNDLLDVSRIEQGKVKEELQQADLSSIVSKTVKEMTPLAKKRSVNLVFEEKKVGRIKMYPLQFQEVVTNLLSNAIKYNSYGGRVIVKIEPKKEEIVVQIANTGSAIPPEEQREIFSKFFRGKRAVKSETEGTGLGLFVVKSYVEAWGGRIWFKSPTMGKDMGTTFYFSLPLKPSEPLRGKE